MESTPTNGTASYTSCIDVTFNPDLRQDIFLSIETKSRVEFHFVSLIKFDSKLNGRIIILGQFSGITLIFNGRQVVAIRPSFLLLVGLLAGCYDSGLLVTPDTSSWECERRCISLSLALSIYTLELPKRDIGSVNPEPPSYYSREILPPLSCFSNISIYTGQWTHNRHQSAGIICSSFPVAYVQELHIDHLDYTPN